eukprot:TRINITY_DN23948_c0_g1_i3.p1 TRINITY_DN23948_c0_g1~~TRINITY_DN23948_c0_g1_i3.p1  ORF type:complete len:476 (+),score=103.86 TRINITY_DN23948_c0_g1_i3:71-1498(+)
MIRRPPRSTLSSSSAASDVYKRQYQRRVRGVPQKGMESKVNSGAAWIYTMGLNDHGQLGIDRKQGHGNEDDLQLIDLIRLFGRFHSKVVAKKIVCGAQHTVMLAQPMGELYVWGGNKYSQLGNPDLDVVTPHPPMLLQALQGQTVSDVSAGAKHTVAVLDDGEVYAWGCNSDGQCGLPPKIKSSISAAHKGETVDTPTLVSYFTGEKGFKVACGTHHSMVLCVSGAEFVKSDDHSMFSRMFYGKVHSFGSNRCGQLGREVLGEEHRHGSDLAKNSWLVQELAELKVIEIASGQFHSLALLHDGTMLSWGFGELGRLGLGSEDSQHRPVALSPLPGDALPVRIECGGQHSLCLTNNGALYTWGRGKEGQLGHGDKLNRRSPCRVVHLSNKMVLQASAGNISTACMCDNSKLYLWGCVSRGKRVSVPQIIKSLMMSAGHSVYCGYHLSLIHISEPTRLLSISYAVFCLKKKKKKRSL